MILFQDYRNNADESSKGFGPPSDIIPLITKPQLSGEGVWEPLYVMNNKDILYKSIIRPDRDRYWAVVDLCCIKTEYVNLNLTFGSS